MMKTMTVLTAFFASSMAFAMSQKLPDIKYTKGTLKKISCKFSGNRSQTGPSLGQVDFKDDASTVCNPLSDSSATTTPESGLLAKLFIKSDAMDPKNQSVMEYYNKGTALDKKIYFADVNVPTQRFTKGFQTESGAKLTDNSGNILIENFALEYNTVLQLGAKDSEGDYELASLADDGARVFVKENGAWNELINNDGQHATRMGCPWRTINLKKDSQIPVKILYYQGPRFYLANVLIWKKHSKAQSWTQPSDHDLCGFTGNDYFYNSANGKKSVGMAYLELIGWRTIAAENFKMPAQISNPCPPPVPDLTISKFAISSMANGNATLTWETNLPANSQLHIVNYFAGEEMYTDVDATMVTSHTAKVSGLTPGMYYQVQAISVDEKGRQVLSAFIDLAP